MEFQDVEDLAGWLTSVNTRYRTYAGEVWSKGYRSVGELAAAQSSHLISPQIGQVKAWTMISCAQQTLQGASLALSPFSAAAWHHVVMHLVERNDL